MTKEVAVQGLHHSTMTYFETLVSQAIAANKRLPQQMQNHELLSQFSIAYKTLQKTHIASAAKINSSMMLFGVTGIETA